MKKITSFLLVLFSAFVSYAQLAEGFEGTALPNYTTDDWALSSGTWKVYDNGIGLVNSWTVNTIAANVNTGSRAAYLNRETLAPGTFAEDWLVTPSTSVPNNGQLRFWTKQTLAGNQGSSYSIRVSTTSQTDVNSFTTIQTWTETEMNATYNVYEEKVVSLVGSGYTAGQTIFIAFVMTNNNGDRWLVDDVNVVEQCLDPTTQTATNASLTTSDLGWDNPSGASQWEVEIVGTGTAPTGTGVIATTNPYTATGLTASTCYDFYVRALCASGSNSEWIGPFNFCTASLGETCGAPIQIPSIPYTTTDNTSGYGDDVSGSPGSGCGSSNPYLNGNDVFYTFTATSNNSVTITSQTTSTWSGLFVYSSCANVGVSCLAGNVSGNGSTTVDTVTFTPVIGQTYYIVISTWATNIATQSVPYTLTIVENTCTNMAASFAVVSNCTSTTNPDTFFVEATVTSMGSATSIAGTSTPASPTAVPSITSPGVMQFGPFPNNTPVTINLQNEQDVNCFRNSTSLTQVFCPATNDLCSGAIPITCGSTVTQTTVGATTTGAPGTCGTTGGAGGLWYSFLGNGDVVTFSLCGSSFDTKIQVVTGNCGAFTCVTGNDDFAGCGLSSQVQVSTAVGTVYYVYVFGFGTAQGVFTLNTTCITPPPPPANDGCDTATNVTVNTDGTCTQITPGTVVGATPSSQANGCTGTADDDVWFQFTATQASHTVSLLNIAGSTLDLNHAVYTSTNLTNPCDNLTQVLCSNPNLSIASPLVVGQVYYIRVYTATATPLQTTTFDVCVSVPPPPPSNDSCATPLVAPVNTSTNCTAITPGTITSATASPEPNACTGTADDDVWFQFTATANLQNINLNNIQGTTTDLAFAVYSGANCNSLTQINCQTNNNGVVGGLNIGDVYWIRVYSQQATPNMLANFDLCITTPTQCNNAQTACGDGTIFNNQIGLPSYGSIGCLFTTPNPFWYQIEIEVSGPITFTLNQTSAGNSDVDFILWGPFTSAQINSNACNNLYDYPDGNTGIPNNIVDCSYSASATEIIDIPNAIAGQHYLLLVTNYGNSIGTFNFNQTGGTGLASCCNVNLGPDVVLCNQTTHTINGAFSPINSVPDTRVWYKDNVLIPGETSASLTVTESGVYKCEITCGQTTDIDEVTVTFNTITADVVSGVAVCGSYVLPALSANNTYYTGTNGTGTMLNVGDVITSSQTIYIFTETGTTPNCTDESSFDVTITPTPTPDAPSDVVVCDSYTLPALTVGNYYTGTNATGTMLNVGDVITTSQTLYVYASAGTAPNICSAENSFSVTINSITADVISDVAVCDSYVLPALSANNTYYTGINGTGTMLNAGDVVTASQTIYIFAQTGTTPNCTDESSFDVTITTTPTPDAPADVVECDSYTLPALTVGNYYTGTNATGTMLNVGDVITTSQTLYVYASAGTAPNICSAENSFSVTINSITADVVSDVAVCDSYVLPTLSANNTYYTGTNGTGTMLNAGDVVTASQTIYIFAQTGTTPNCTDESSFTVSITQAPTAPIIQDSAVCTGGVYTFPNTASTYYSGTLGTGTAYSPSETVTITATQTFYVYVATGSCFDETSFTVTAVDLPEVTLAGGCLNNVYTITATVTTGESVTYEWSDALGVIPNQTGSSLVVSQDGTYSCVVTLASGQLCESSTVFFLANGTLCTIQKGISPNGDGLNDNFELTGLNVKKLEIFNRYGIKVYSYSNYTNQWYGQSDKGDELPTGTYYYVIARDNVAAESGWIYINRQ